MVHLPPGPQHSNGSQHPASGLLHVNLSYKDIELHSRMYSTYIGIGIRMIPVEGEVSDFSGILIDFSEKGKKNIFVQRRVFAF